MTTNKKCHNWTPENDFALKKALEDCQPIFEHFKTQNKSYKESNAWDAVAGRLLPDICVTGSACRRRWQVLLELESKDDAWAKVSEQVVAYERDLLETTFDGVSELLGNIDALHDRIGKLESKLDILVKIWTE